MNKIKCTKDKIYNKETKRCIKKDSKKGVELLYEMNDKKTHKLYEKIDGKIIKKITGGTNSIDMEKKVAAIKRVKQILSQPFINRVSADIYRRNNYLVLMKRELKDKKTGCLKVYKQNKSKYSYRIGNKIILEKRIGSESAYGEVYLSNFREKTKKIFSFATKIYKYLIMTTAMELSLLEQLTNIVRMDKCPHFLIFYGYVICENFNTSIEDSYEKSNSIKTVSQTYEKMPLIIQDNYNEKIITLFVELANGDLHNFYILYGDNAKIMINSLIQQLLSIMFFNYYTKRIHIDTHCGNFLYHKISPGGYFHYNLFGIDYYLENLGFLWVLWDFDLSLNYDDAIEYYNQLNIITNDYTKIISNHIFKLKTLDNPELYKFVKEMFDFYSLEINFYDETIPTILLITKYIYLLPNYISERKLNDNFIFLKTLPTGAKLINKSPYVINNTEDNELFKYILFDK
jgi:hypothetical protein